MWGFFIVLNKDTVPLLLESDLAVNK